MMLGMAIAMLVVFLVIVLSMNVANISYDADKNFNLGRARLYVAEGNFTTTDTTLTLSVPFRKIQAALAAYDDDAAVSTDGPLMCSQTVSSGKLTVTRVAGTTSGAGVRVLVIGY
jgi:hypothetical protein